MDVTSGRAGRHANLGAMSEYATVWERLRDYAATQTGPFTTQEVLSWFRRHVPSQANAQTVRTHLRGACWNVDDRHQFASKEPFLTRLDRGMFRRATDAEVAEWPHRKPLARAIGTSVQAPATSRQEPEDEWHTEANVQASVVRHLATTGWSILSVADTATRQRGIDVVATREGTTVGVEVKGYPSARYADPARALEAKITSPTNQSPHWYAQAVLAAMRLRTREPDYRSVIALPDFPRYRDLYTEPPAP